MSLQIIAFLSIKIVYLFNLQVSFKKFYHQGFGQKPSNRRMNAKPCQPPWGSSWDFSPQKGRTSFIFSTTLKIWQYVGLLHICFRRIMQYVASEQWAGGYPASIASSIHLLYQYLPLSRGDGFDPGGKPNTLGFHVKNQCFLIFHFELCPSQIYVWYKSLSFPNTQLWNAFFDPPGFGLCEAVKSICW